MPALVVLCALESSAVAQAAPGASTQTPVVVLLSGAPFAEREGLEPALRIQLTARAELRVRATPADAGSSLPAQVRAASQVADAEDADWIVWADEPAPSPDGELEAVLYLVGPRRDRALVEVVRVPAGPGPEVDRSLALKVGELVLGTGEEGHVAAVALGQPRELLGEAAEQERAVSLLLELGPELATRPGSDLGQMALWLGAGPSFRLPHWVISVPIGLALSAPIELESDAGEVDVFALAPRVIARAEYWMDAIAVGGVLGFELTWVSAEGVAASGVRGEEQVLLPTLVMGLDVGVALGDGFALRLFGGVQQRLRRQRFELEERAAADLGRTAAFGQLALGFEP